MAQKMDHFWAILAQDGSSGAMPGIARSSWPGPPGPKSVAAGRCQKWPFLAPACSNAFLEKWPFFRHSAAGSRLQNGRFSAKTGLTDANPTPDWHQVFGRKRRMLQTHTQTPHLTSSPPRPGTPPARLRVTSLVHSLLQARVRG